MIVSGRSQPRRTPQRALVALGALAGALAGCPGAPADDAAPPSTLTVLCGSYDTGVTAGLVLTALIDPPRPGPVVLDVLSAGLQVQMTCPAKERRCVASFPEIAAWNTARVAAPFAAMVAGDLGSGYRAWTPCSADPDGALPQPEGRAEVAAGKLEVDWAPVPGATLYVATFRDLDLRPPEARRPRTLGTVSTTDTHASFDLPEGTPALGVVELEAWALLPPVQPPGVPVPDTVARGSMRAIPVIGAPWALKQPSDFTSGALQVPVPAGSRVAVILLNLDGRASAPDAVAATVEASGTGPVASAPAAPPVAASARSSTPAGEPSAGALATATGAGRSAIAPEATRTFCTFVAPGSDVTPVNWPVVRRPATLALESGSALFYVDDADAVGFSSFDWSELGAWWEVVRASVTSHSGPPTDVDGDGRFLLFFTSALGPRSWSVANGHDLDGPLTTTPDCSVAVDTGISNLADMIHLHPPWDMEDEAGRLLSREEAWAVLKGRMPYAYQRMVDSNRFGNRVLYAPPDRALTWGRMALAGTLAGSGDHVAALRALASPALFTRAGPGGGWGGYPSQRMFPWFTGEAGPVVTPAQRAGIDSFILYFADRLGPDFVERFFHEATMLRRFEVASGLPYPIAYALWTGALVFSNEPASPWQGFDYLGADWTPLHQKFQRFEYAPLEAGAAATATLRRNGFDVYVTGAAGAGGGTVAVTSAADVKPYVVVIPFQGTLP